MMGGNVLVQGSERHIILQRSTTNDLIVQLRNNGIEIDPRQVQISGQIVQISGQIVQISGQIVQISGQIVQISGQHITITSGDIVTTMSTQYTPIEKVVIHNQVLPAIDTNWLGTDITPTNTPTLFRIMVAISKSGRFKVAMTRGGNTQIIILNNNNDIKNSTVNIFDILVHSGDSINFRFDHTDGIIMILRVQEIDAASQ